MTADALRQFTTPREGDLGLRQISNKAGLAASLLPNGALFVLDHQGDRGRIMLNQVPGSPVHGGIGRICLRIGGETPGIIELVGPSARVRFGAAADRFVWEGETESVRHRVTLWLSPEDPIWLWHIEVTNKGKAVLPCDVILVQDLGLGDRGFLCREVEHARAADGAEAPPLELAGLTRHGEGVTRPAGIEEVG